MESGKNDIYEQGFNSILKLFGFMLKIGLEIGGKMIDAFKHSWGKGF